MLAGWCTGGRESRVMFGVGNHFPGGGLLRVCLGEMGALLAGEELLLHGYHAIVVRARP